MKYKSMDDYIIAYGKAYDLYGDAAFLEDFDVWNLPNKEDLISKNREKKLNELGII